MYRCDKCGNDLKLFTQLDTYGCMTCDEWREDKCVSIRCDFCNSRPDKPSEVEEPTTDNRE